MIIVQEEFLDLKRMSVDVVEAGSRPRRGAIACEIGKNIKFSTQILETFSATNWQSIVYDALILAAAIEFCDRSLRRSSVNWGRRFFVRIPVHEIERWSGDAVRTALTSALNLLTGDDWRIEFCPRKIAAEPPRQTLMEFPTEAEAVIPFSEGMDSYAVASLEDRRLGRKLVRVRVGTKKPDNYGPESGNMAFAALPYQVKLDGNHNETSARSRGFKFCLVAAIGAYLVDAPSVLMPESGQGALAPAIISVGQSYPDYRNHPVFTASMETLVNALFQHKVRYRFPRLWKTKGETLRELIDTCGDDSSMWTETKSCWQQSRHSSVSGTKRQCGICAACMLRRMSVHAANLSEPKHTYVWENLTAKNFEEGASRDFKPSRRTKGLREYAIAGVLHLDHFATLQESKQYELFGRRAESELALAIDEPRKAVTKKFNQLLKQHKIEWEAFLDHLGTTSFVRGWIDRKL